MPPVIEPSEGEVKLMRHDVIYREKWHRWKPLAERVVALLCEHGVEDDDALTIAEEVFQVLPEKPVEAFHAA